MMDAPKEVTEDDKVKVLAVLASEEDDLVEWEKILAAQNVKEDTEYRYHSVQTTTYE